MADIGTRWAVVVIDRFLGEQHLEKHRPSDYEARVISNRQGRELTEKGRNYVFGKTINEVEFWEVDSEQEARRVAAKFNRLWSKRVRIPLHQINTRK